MQYDYDIIIVGGGLAGNCLALALQETGLNIALVEAQTRQQLHESPAGDRALALAAGTIQMLEGLKAWQPSKPFATAITNIHISDAGHFGKTRLSAKKQQVEALGYVIAARDLEGQLAECVEQTSTTLFSPARVVGLISNEKQACLSLKMANETINLSASLIIGADGGNSSIRRLLEIDQKKVDYQQTAIVTTISTEIPHNNTAYERFTRSGPLAMLPIAVNQSALVWTRSHEEAELLLAMSETEFTEQLQQCFGYWLGELKLSAARRAFPLSLIQATQMVKGRVVIIGNAVHQLHPVAGQGFNLGIRDVVQLANNIIKQHQQKQAIGDKNFLENYQTQRHLDHEKTIQFTDNVVKIFSNEWLLLAAIRNTGLTLLDHIPMAKNTLARHAMGLNNSS